MTSFAAKASRLADVDFSDMVLDVLRDVRVYLQRYDSELLKRMFTKTGISKKEIVGMVRFNRCVDITFVSRDLAIKFYENAIKLYENLDELQNVFLKAPIDIPVKLIHVPITLPNDILAKYFNKHHGHVKNISWAKDDFGLLSGERTVTISMGDLNKNPVKSYIYICKREIFVKYRDQIKTCRRCGKACHLQNDKLCDTGKSTKANNDYNVSFPALPPGTSVPKSDNATIIASQTSDKATIIANDNTTTIASQSGALPLPAIHDAPDSTKSNDDIPTENLSPNTSWFDEVVNSERQKDGIANDALAPELDTPRLSEVTSPADAEADKYESAIDETHLDVPGSSTLNSDFISSPVTNKTNIIPKKTATPAKIQLTKKTFNFDLEKDNNKRPLSSDSSVELTGTQPPSKICPPTDVRSMPHDSGNTAM